jgi:hypothetical protein
MAVNRKPYLIRRRETLEDLVGNQILIEDLPVPAGQENGT